MSEYDQQAPAHELRDKRRRDFYIVDNAVSDRYVPVIGATAFTVYCALLRRMRRAERATWPSRDLLAEDTGVSVRSIQRAINTLSGRDAVLERHSLRPLITITQRKNHNGQPYNVYWINEVEASAKTDMDPEGSEGQIVPHMGANLAHKQDEENKREDGTASAVPNRAPNEQLAPDEKITPHDLVARFESVVGLPVANTGKAHGIAKRLVKAGVTPDTLEAQVRWLWADDWHRRKGIDLGTVEATLDKWRTAGTARSEDPDQETVIRLVHAYANRLVKGGVHTPPDVHAVETAIRVLCVTEGERLTPGALDQAMTWAWQRDHKPPSPERLRYVVHDWLAAGKPTPRAANDYHIY